MTHVELFAGIGGFALASQWAGFTHECFVERDEFCQKVLRKHWPMVPIHDDVTTFSGLLYRGVTLLTGGFPCQDVSTASSNTFARGIEGSQSGLFWQLLRVIKEVRPRWVVLENVYQLHARGLDRVQLELERAGYRQWSLAMGAGSTGAPHQRKRIFVVGYSDGHSEPMRPVHAKAQGMPGFSGHAGWEAVPESVRVDDGVSRGMDRRRLKALGNAVCPQQVYPILQWIADFERGER